MSVEQYGARLLGEVQEETLDELLKELRTTVNPTPNDILSFAQLDKLLELFRFHQRQSPPQRPGWTLPSQREVYLSDDEAYGRGHGYVGPHEPSTRRAHHRLPIIEITSQKSAAGKTTILYYLTALALLPREYGSKESAVIWLDTDNRFSATRLTQVISHILSPDRSNPPSAVDNINSSSLRNLSVLKPHSSASLLSALRSLPSHLLNHTSCFSPNRPLGLLILDSATAFAFQDRFDADIARLEAGPDTTNTSTTPSSTSQIITALRQIQADFECSILFTTTQQHQRQPHRHDQPNRNPNPSAQVVPDESLPITPWTSFATLTLTASRIPVPQFAPNMSVDECLRDKEKRQEAVSRGRLSVNLNWEGSDMWPPGVRDVLMGMDGKGGFVLRITDAGLDVE